MTVCFLFEDISLCSDSDQNKLHRCKLLAWPLSHYAQKDDDLTAKLQLLLYSVDLLHLVP